MIRIASYNVENLFARPKAFGTTMAFSEPILDAYNEVSDLFAKPIYNTQDKARIIELLLELDIYKKNNKNAIRRKRTSFPRWAWLRKNRGNFDRQPKDDSKNVEIIATGRGDWIGWVELAIEPTNEISTRMTARVIKDINANILGIVEAEDRPSLVRFNKDLLDNLYKHVMLVDGNDERGIDVGIMTSETLPIGTIRSNVDTEDHIGKIFSRDCPQYEIQTESGSVIYILINHFKSQSGGGGSKRQRQSKAVRNIAEDLVSQNKHVIVLGDLNEGPKSGQTIAENLKTLYNNNSPLIDCYTLPNFDLGNRPGTFDSCGLHNRLDYIFISQSLLPHFEGGKISRKGLWGKRKSRPTNWDTYSDMTKSEEQASDHALIYIDLDL